MHDGSAGWRSLGVCVAPESNRRWAGQNLGEEGFRPEAHAVDDAGVYGGGCFFYCGVSVGWERALLPHPIHGPEIGVPGVNRSLAFDYFC